MYRQKQNSTLDWNREKNVNRREVLIIILQTTRSKHNEKAKFKNYATDRVYSYSRRSSSSSSSSLSILSRTSSTREPSGREASCSEPATSTSTTTAAESAVVLSRLLVCDFDLWDAVVEFL